MSDRAVYSPSNLTAKQYREKLISENIMDKFDAIKYEIQQMKPESFSYLRLLTYLEWFFDKVIEERVPDKIAQQKLRNLNFDNKIELMRKWELLIEDNLCDVKLIKDIRNNIAHSLLYDQNVIDDRLRIELKNYSRDDFKDLHPFDKCVGTIVDIMSIFATAINTHFEYTPTRKYGIK